MMVIYRPLGALIHATYIDLHFCTLGKCRSPLRHIENNGFPMYPAYTTTLL